MLAGGGGDAGDGAGSILSEKDPAVKAHKLKAYISQALVSGYNSQRLRRDYCDNDFIKICEGLFGEGRDNSLPWLESANGERFWDYLADKRKNSKLPGWSREKRKRAQAAADMVDLLAVGDGKQYSLMSVTTRKRFTFPVDFLPKTTQQGIRSGQGDDLLVLLMSRQLAETGRRPVLKETATTISLSLTETALFYFLHYSVSTTRKGGSLSDSYNADGTQASARTKDLLTQVSSTTMPTLTVGGVGQAPPLALLYRSVRSLKDRSPHRSVFWQYLLHYLPYESEGVPPRDSDLFLLAAAGFLLRQNAASVVPMSGQPTTQPTMVDVAATVPSLGGGFGVRGSASASTTGGSTLTTSRAVDRYITNRSDYVPPTAEGLECVVLFLTYLFEDPLLRRCIIGVADSGMGTPFGTVADVPTVRLTPVLQAVHESFFHFFRVAIDRCSIDQAFGTFSKVVDAWLVILTPWRSEHRLKDRMYLPPHVDGVSALTRLALNRGRGSRPPQEWGDFESKRARGYADWESYVVLNYSFYLHILGVFMKRLSKCDFSSSNPSVFDMLERVLDVFEPCIVDTLETCSTVIDDMRPKRGHRRRGGSASRGVGNERGRKFRALLEQHHAMLQFKGPIEDTLHEHGMAASTLIDRLRLGAMAGRQSGSRVPLARQHQRLFKRRGGDGWCDPCFERVLRMWMNVSSRKHSGNKGAQHHRIMDAAARIASIFSLESKLTASLDDEGLSSPVASAGSSLMAHQGLDRVSGGLLSDAGQRQLFEGKHACDPLDVRFQGPKGARPVGSHEAAGLVRGTQRLAVWVQCLWGAPPASTINVADRMAAIADADREVMAWSGSRPPPGFMRLQALRVGPPHYWFRVLADKRFAAVLAVGYVLSGAVLLGWRLTALCGMVCYLIIRLLM